MNTPDRKKLAAKAARDLINLLPPQDFGDAADAVMGGVAATLMNYHQQVIAAAPLKIAQRTDRLTLKIVTDVCDELQAPISRTMWREDVLRLPEPDKPDDATRDAQLLDYEQRIKPVLVSAFQPIEPARVEATPDGRHFDRIKGDLEARKARNEALMASTGPPDPIPKSA